MKRLVVAGACLLASISSPVSADDSDKSKTIQTVTLSGDTTTTTTTTSGIAGAQARATLEQSEIANANAIAGSGISGTVTPGSGAGQLEGNILVTAAINRAADEIVNRITAAGTSDAVNKGLLIITGFGGLDVSTAFLYDGRRDDITGEFDEAANAYDEAIGKAQIRTESFVVGAAIAATVATKALSFFMTNYGVSGLTINTNDNMLAAAVAAREPSSIMWSQMLNFAAGKSVLDDLTMLDKKVATLNADVVEGTKLLKQKKWKNNKDLAAAVTGLQTAVSDYAAFKLWVLGGTSGGSAVQANLPEIVQQYAALDILKNGGTVLSIQIDNAAGGFITKQNLWTEFGAMPFYASGGITVTYALYGPKNDARPAAIQKLLDAMRKSGDNLDTRYNFSLLSAGLFSVMTPYRKVHRVTEYAIVDSAAQIARPAAQQPVTNAQTSNLR